MPIVWDVNREIATFGFLALRWYSLLFAGGIMLGFYFTRRLFKAEGKPEEALDGMLMYVVIGTIVGARLGHCLLYEPMEYLSNPLRILKVWEGGLASHGGFTGVIIALILYCRRYPEFSFWWLADRIAMPAMIAAGCIRLGNLFNSEIIGRPSDVPWAFVFAKVDQLPRHPTQIYESIGYFSIFAILYAVYRVRQRQIPEGRLFGLVLVLAFSFRMFIETFKENQEAFEQDMLLNMGQLLSVPFIIVGLLFLFGVHERILPFNPKAAADDDATADHARRGQLRKQMRKAQKAKT